MSDLWVLSSGQSKGAVVNVGAVLCAVQAPLTVFLLTDPVSRPPCRLIKSSASSRSRLQLKKEKYMQTGEKKALSGLLYSLLLPGCDKDRRVGMSASESYWNNQGHRASIQPLQQDGLTHFLHHAILKWLAPVQCPCDDKRETCQRIFWSLGNFLRT